MDIWERSNTTLNDNTLTINFRGPFVPRRGRINCSLNDNGKWRWFGVQFPIKNNLGGSLFQVIANKGNSRLLPWMKFQYSDNRLAHQINFTKEVFYLQGDPDNTNFDKIGYKFYLGNVKDYKDYRTLSLKILASKKENGEIIGWLDDKRIFEVYGPNFTIGNGYTFKWGFYTRVEKMS